MSAVSEDEVMVTTAEASKLLGISARSITDRFRFDPDFPPAYRYGERGHLRFKKVDILNYRESKKEEA